MNVSAARPGRRGVSRWRVTEGVVVVMVQRQALLVLAALGWMVGCGGGDEVDEVDVDHVDSESEAEALHWSYAGEAGPERWGELDASFATCGSGQKQSPIDIPASITPGHLSALTFDY